jgi:hypothetical protein
MPKRLTELPTRDLWIAPTLSLMLCVLALPALAGETVITINSLGDDGANNAGDGICATGNPFGPGGFLNECTLRAALEEANAVPGPFRIEISSDISVNAQEFSQIDIGSGLPAITDVIYLDGTTHPEWDPDSDNLQPRLAVNWTGGDGTAFSGIRLNAGSAGSTIRAIAITNFTASGIRIAGGSGFTIAQNIIGGIWRPNVISFAGNDRHGIDLNGGSSAANPTVIINNIIFDNGQHGIRVRNGFASGLIADNIIGPRPPPGDGSTGFLSDRGNGGSGIRIESDAGEGNWIGRLFSTPGNTISANGERGIHLAGNNQTIVGNQIGVPVNDQVHSDEELGDYGNDGSGILITGNDNVIGGEDDLINVIGNSGSGVGIRVGSATISAVDNAIRGNRIGVDQLGRDIGQLVGVRFERGSDNVLSGARVFLNTVGVEFRAPGNLAVSNAIRYSSIGVWFRTGGRLGSTNDQIERNIIGNHLQGILVAVDQTDPEGVRIFNNYIGTNSQADDLNNASGIVVTSGGLVQIGQPGGRNVIGHNTDNGIWIVNTVGGGGQQPDYRIESNLVGIFSDTTPIPNGTGIRIGADNLNASGVRVGPPVTFPPHLPQVSLDRGNVIASNLGDGIDLSPADGSAVQIENSIRGNRFFLNGGQAINLGPGGDEADVGADGSEEGPNRLQNFPTFDTDQTYYSAGDGAIHFRYGIGTNPTNATYPLIVDFYLSENPDAQGALYLGSDVYDVDDYGSMITGQIPYDGEFEGFLTASVTDAAGNTSQFSTAVISIDFPDEMFRDRFESP